jgi:8-oxo-dGTP diphosphatase
MVAWCHRNQAARRCKLGIPHPGCWSGFGGAVEDGESAEDAVRREVLEETGVSIAEPVFLTEELDAEGDGRLVSLFYVAGGITPDDIDLSEGAGVGVHAIADLDSLPVAPFVYRAIRSHLPLGSRGRFSGQARRLHPL